MNSCKRLGLQIHLAQDENEQKYVNSLATFSSSWLRIKFSNDEAKTDDKFQGKIECLILATSFCIYLFFSEMIVFEEWIEIPFSSANHEPESAINLADLYWQGLDLNSSQISLSILIGKVAFNF